jgi:hypothetical protein
MIAFCTSFGTLPVAVQRAIWSNLIKPETSHPEEAIRSGPRVIAEFLDREGQLHVVTEDDV